MAYTHFNPLYLYDSWKSNYISPRINFTCDRELSDKYQCFTPANNDSFYILPNYTYEQNEADIEALNETITTLESKKKSSDEKKLKKAEQDTMLHRPGIDAFVKENDSIRKNLVKELLELRISNSNTVQQLAEILDRSNIGITRLNLTDVQWHDEIIDVYGSIREKVTKLLTLFSPVLIQPVVNMIQVKI